LRYAIRSPERTSNDVPSVEAGQSDTVFEVVRREDAVRALYGLSANDALTIISPGSWLLLMHVCSVGPRFAM
jgi:hypothetical protein